MISESEYVRLRDVPALLGIARRTVYDWIAAGKLQRYELHGVPYVRRADLEPTYSPTYRNQPHTDALHTHKAAQRKDGGP